MNHFYNEVSDYMRKNPQQRFGQAVFNVMYEWAPDVANKYRGTELDPFYHDHRVQRFVQVCFSEMKTN